MSEPFFMLVDLIPPGLPPSQLCLGGMTYSQNSGGSFRGVDIRLTGPLVQAGWTAVTRPFQTIASGQTVILNPGYDAVLDTSFGLATAKLPSAPVASQENPIRWTRGTIVPVIDGNGLLVESFASRGTFAATTTINQAEQPNRPSIVYFNGTNWVWR